MRTRLVGYLIADITLSLKNILEYYGLNRQLPGRPGYYWDRPSRAVYNEVLEYDKIVGDARIRHDVFFDKLEIN